MKSPFLHVIAAGLAALTATTIAAAQPGIVAQAESLMKQARVDGAFPRCPLGLCG